MAIKNLSIRIDETMLDKLHVVADYEGRSANSQILMLIRNDIDAYENKHGVIFESRSPWVKRKNNKQFFEPSLNEQENG